MRDKRDLINSGQTYSRAFGQREGLIAMLSMTAALLMGVPFVWQGKIGAEGMINGEILLAATFLLTATSFWYATVEVSRSDALRLFLLVFCFGWAAEFSGLRTAFPFGCQYVYHAAFQPQLPGGIPLAIPLSWYVIIRLPIVLLRRWVKPQNQLRYVVLKAILCGVFMAGCALILDPLGQASGLWTFATDNGSMLQATNAIGWGLVGLVSSGIYFALEAHEPGILRNEGLEGLILTMALAFHGLAIIAGANRLDDWHPLVFSCLLMVPCWVCWWRLRQCRVIQCAQL